MPAKSYVGETVQAECGNGHEYEIPCAEFQEAKDDPWVGYCPTCGSMKDKNGIQNWEPVE